MEKIQDKALTALAWIWQSHRVTKIWKSLVVSWDTVGELWTSGNDASVPKLCLNPESSSDEGFVGSNAVVQISVIVWYLQATLIFVDFTKALDSIHRGKMEQILLAYGLPKETVAEITILYRNTKVKVCSPVGDTEYFDIVAGVLQGDMQAPCLFIICLDYVLRTSIDKIRENGFELTKKRSRRYPAKTITDADYADDIAILANTPNQAETLLHCLERAATGIWSPCQCTQNGIYVL